MSEYKVCVRCTMSGHQSYECKKPILPVQQIEAEPAKMEPDQLEWWQVMAQGMMAGHGVNP